METITLKCYVYGDDIQELFNVEISRTRTVMDLRRAIKNKCPVKFYNVDAADLDLYLIPIPDDAFLENKLKHLDLKHQPTLDPRSTLSNLNLSDRVIVVNTCSLAPKKHALEELDIFQKLKYAKIAQYAPSTMGVPQYRDLQLSVENRLLDHRAIAIVQDEEWSHKKLPDEDLPPIALVYQPFGKFLDVYLGQHKGSLTQASALHMREQVDIFATLMSKIYIDEDNRQAVCLPLLNNIFHIALGAIYPSMKTVTIGDIIVDGHSPGPHGEPIMMVNVKNEMSDISSSPILEVCNYYHHLVRKFANDHSRLFLASKMPMLALTVVGPVITFYAVVCVGQYHYLSLTPGLSCIDGAVGGDDRQKLYSAFTAAATLLDCILQDISLISENPPPPIKNRFFPTITELPSVNGSNTPIKFQITHKILSSPKRQLYLGTSTDGKNQQLVIKFAHTYSPELHMYCASAGHAPVLHGFGKLPGNFFGIAMDFVTNADYLDSSNSSDDLEIWAGQLVQLVKSFHAAGYVHGDLQYSNVLHVNNNVMLLDYDWGGKEGEAFYPDCTLAPDLTKGQSRTDLMITKEDDLQILAATLKQIGVTLPL